MAHSVDPLDVLNNPAGFGSDVAQAIGEAAGLHDADDGRLRDHNLLAQVDEELNRAAVSTAAAAGDAAADAAAQAAWAVLKAIAVPAAVVGGVLLLGAAAWSVGREVAVRKVLG